MRKSGDKESLYKHRCALSTDLDLFQYRFNWVVRTKIMLG